jgi:hypothetical protein
MQAVWPKIWLLLILQVREITHNVSTGWVLRWTPVAIITLQEMNAKTCYMIAIVIRKEQILCEQVSYVSAIIIVWCVKWLHSLTVFYHKYQYNLVHFWNRKLTIFFIHDHQSRKLLKAYGMVLKLCHVFFPFWILILLSSPPIIGIWVQDCRDDDEPRNSVSADII